MNSYQGRSVQFRKSPYRAGKGRLRAAGVTLVELVMVTAVLLIASLGTIQTQYFSVQHSKKGEARKIALNTCLLLLEDWKSNGGAASYDPSTLGMAIQSTQGGYTQTVDNLPMHIFLSHQNLQVDSVSGAILRKLEVTVRWRRDYATGALDGNPETLALSTYVRIDQTSG